MKDKLITEIQARMPPRKSIVANEQNWNELMTIQQTAKHDFEQRAPRL